MKCPFASWNAPANKFVAGKIRNAMMKAKKGSTPRYVHMDASTTAARGCAPVNREAATSDMQ